MMTVSLDEYEQLVDRVLSGNFSPEDLMNFVKNTPILPILAKGLAGTNKAIITVIVTDKNGLPVQGAKVLLAGEAKTTDFDGKATFEFPFDVGPGVVLITKGTSISKVPFNGAKVGDRVVLTTMLCKEAESPLAVGESLKDVINTYFQWKLIQDVGEGVFRPDLSQFPQVGILKRKSDYEYQVYIPVPVNIRVPAINFTPSISIPGLPPQQPPTGGPTSPIVPPNQITPIQPPMPPTPGYPQPAPPLHTTPMGYQVIVAVVPGENAPRVAPISVTLSGISNTTFVKTATGSYGVFTFKEVPPGTYKITVNTPTGIMTKNITVTDSNITEKFVVSATGTPTMPQQKGDISITISNETELPVDIKIDNGGFGEKSIQRGTVTFRDVPVGMHKVDIYYNGKLVYSRAINVIPNMVAHITYAVHPTLTPTGNKGTIIVTVYPQKPLLSPPTKPPHGAPPYLHGIPKTGYPSPIMGPGLIIRPLAISTPHITVAVDNIVKTGGFGRYMFNNINPGYHIVRVVYNGHIVKEERVHVPAGGTEVVSVLIRTSEISPTPTPTPPHGAPHTPSPHPPVSNMMGGIRVSIPNHLGTPAEIKIDNGRYGAKTTTGGSIMFYRIPEGYHSVEVFYMGRQVCSKRVYVKANQTTVVTCTISTQPTPPHGISPTPTPPHGPPVIRTL